MHDIDIVQVQEARELLGQRFQDLVIGYIADMQSVLSAIDVARSTGNEIDIAKHMHAVKSSSYQVGANKVKQQAELIEMYISNNQDNMNMLPFQTRIEGMLEQFRRYFSDYQENIMPYL